MFSKEALAKPCYEAIKKISKGKWEWEPQIGEQCIHQEGGYTQLISDIDKKTGDLYLSDLAGISGHIWLHSIYFTPILHWERIEEILEGMGYKVWTNKFYDNPRGKYLCKIAIPDHEFDTATVLVKARANSAQEAVQEAVIELEKQRSKP